MTEPASPIAGLRQRYDDLPPEWRQRIPALALALAVEILLVLVLLSLGSVKREVVAMTDTLVAFTTSSQDEEEAVADAPTPAEIPEAAQPQVSQTQPEDAAAEPRPQVVPPLPVPRPVLRNDFSLERVPRQAPPAPAEKPQAYGPPDTSSPGDTLRIAGSGPNGEPLYAARWYRRPYDDELAGWWANRRKGRVSPRRCWRLRGSSRSVPPSAGAARWSANGCESGFPTRSIQARQRGGGCAINPRQSPHRHRACS